MTPALPALLADLEAAPEGSLTLDERIALALGWTPNHTSDGRIGSWMKPGEADGPRRALPLWTTSMDAVLTLVPPLGFPMWTLRLETVSHGSHGLSHAVKVTVPSYEYYGRGATLALAACGASLRARCAA